MNTQKSVFKKIAKINEPKIELSEVQKVELARKPQSVLKELQALDGRLRKIEDKMSQAYKAYRNAYNDLESAIAKESAERKKLEGDLLDIDVAARDLGVMPNQIEGMEQAEALSSRLDGLLKDLAKLYDKI
jgi:SMC interacting uncharacterized protein involved in chromosome segregation